MANRATGTQSTITAAQARRLLMQGQGLLHDPAKKATPAAVYKTIERMGYVQVDTINAVERAHHHILMTRFDGYEKRMLTKLLETDRKLFEHWTHDAAIIPAIWLRYWHLPYANFKTLLDSNDWMQRRLGDEAPKVIRHVKRRIKAEGSLRSRDFEHPERKSTPWWGWKPQKAALEYLWYTGTLAISGRDNFHKKYDLMERVHPDHARDPKPRRADIVDWVCRMALDKLGTATHGELAEFWKMLKPPEVREWCEKKAGRGEIENVLVESEDGSKSRTQYAATDWKKRLRDGPEPPARMRLLSPFDPVIRDRKRLKRLFDFEYAFEGFVPEAKRKFGYYVLPILDGERLVGRCDPKLHRDEGVLKVRKVWWEPGGRATKKRRAALEAAIDRFATQLGAASWTLPKRA